MSLAACGATPLAYLLCREGRTVKACEVDAERKTKELKVVGFEWALLHFHQVSPDVTAKDLDRSPGLARGSACTVWQMVKGNFEIETCHNFLGTA
ncbi:MAG: hypothetical protein PVJ01_02230 [Pseudomonadota bacterium]|jgi:uncharacterized OsmC-like protein